MPDFGFKSPMTDVALGIVDEDGWSRVVKLERSFLQKCAEIQDEQAEALEVSVQTCNAAHIVHSWEKHLSSRLTGLLMLSLAFLIYFSLFLQNCIQFAFNLGQVGQGHNVGSSQPVGCLSLPFIFNPGRRLRWERPL